MTDIIYDYYIPTKDFLEILAAKPQTITYMELVEKIDMNLDLDNYDDLMQLSRLLDVISISTYKANNIFLSSIVIRKIDPKIPGDGYFKMVEEQLKRKIIDKEKFVAQQQELVFRKYDPNRKPRKYELLLKKWKKS